jgi:hypothetical protein
MAQSKEQFQDRVIRNRVIREYTSEPYPTLRDLGARVGVSYHTAAAIVKDMLTDEEYQLQKSLRYSRGKVGDLNPMKGKNGSLHHNYKGILTFGEKGYPVKKIDGKYRLMHHLVMAEALGIPKIPEGFVVHHIDGNTQNFSLDNLALVTLPGHRRIHARNPLKKLSLWEKKMSGTLK